MKRDIFENRIKEAMLSYEMPVDGPDIWAGVEQKLYGKKKKRTWWLWWTGALAVIFLSVGGYFTYSSNGPSTHHPTTSIASNVSSKDNATLHQISSLVDSKGKKTTNISPNSSSSTISKQNNRSQGKTPETPVTSLHSNVKTGTITNKNLNARQSNSTQTKQTLKPNKSYTSLYPFTWAQEKAQQTPNVQSKDNNSSNQKQTSSMSMNRMGPIIPGLPSLSSYLELGNEWKHTILSFILMQMIYAEDDDADQKHQPGLTPHAHLGYALSAQAGYGFIQRQLTSSTPNDDYKTLRDATENTLESLQGRLAIDILPGKHWKFALGLDFTAINEELNYTYTGYTDEILRDTIVKYLKDNTKSISYEDRKVLYDSSYHTFNSHEMVGLSLQAGYRWSSNQWNFSFNAGTKYDIWQRSRGYQTTPNGKVTAFDTRSDLRPLYKTKGNLWVTSTFCMGYQWDQHHEMLFSLSEQFLLNNIGNTTYNPIRQQYNLHVLRLGYRYHF